MGLGLFLPSLVVTRRKVASSQDNDLHFRQMVSVVYRSDKIEEDAFCSVDRECLQATCPVCETPELLLYPRCQGDETCCQDAARAARGESYRNKC